MAHPKFSNSSKPLKESVSLITPHSYTTNCPKEEFNTFTKSFQKNRRTADVHIIKRLEIEHHIDRGREILRALGRKKCATYLLKIPSKSGSQEQEDYAAD
jgi:hypothetical protein